MTDCGAANPARDLWGQVERVPDLRARPGNVPLRDCGLWTLKHPTLCISTEPATSAGNHQGVVGRSGDETPRSLRNMDSYFNDLFSHPALHPLSA